MTDIAKEVIKKLKEKGFSLEFRTNEEKELMQFLIDNGIEHEIEGHYKRILSGERRLNYSSQAKLFLNPELKLIWSFSSRKRISVSEFIAMFKTPKIVIV